MGNENIRMGQPIPDRGMTWFGPVRVAYAHIDEPSGPKGSAEDQKKYKLTMMVPKSETEALGVIGEMYNAAMAEGTAKWWSKGKPAKFSECLTDGDTKDDPVFHGHVLVQVGSKFRPSVFDSMKKQVTAPGLIYSGCWCWVRIAFLPFSVAGGNGISGIFNDVLFAADGDRLGGGGTTEEHLADLAFTGLRAPTPAGVPGFAAGTAAPAAPAAGFNPLGFGAPGAAPAGKGGAGSGLPF